MAKRLKKTRKNIKYKRKTNKRYQKGGGKTYEEIVAELKAKGKYDEWISKGAMFTYSAPFFLSQGTQNKYTFIDMNGNPVKGPFQSKEFRADLSHSIPIFGQIITKDPDFVNQAKFRIVPTGGRLKTAGLATCSGLSIKIGSKKFLTHLDATTEISPMISAIKAEMESAGTIASNAIVYKGNLMGSEITEKKAIDIATAVGIDPDTIQILNVCMMNDIVI